MAQNMQSAVDVWFASIGTAPDYETMHYWAGTGQSTFDINFAGGYISREHVKAFIREDDTGTTSPVSLTFQTASRVVTSQPVPVGWTICIYRDTPKNAPLALFVDGAILNAVNLDRNAKQAVFAVAELLDRFDATNAMADEAILRASEAKTAAAQAAADAASAESKVTIAQGAASAAEASAQNAAALAGTANSNASTALSVANGIDAKATDALSKSGQAVAIATDAESVANAIDAKATTALSQSSAAAATANTAMTTANQAKSTADGVDAKATDAQTKANTILGAGISLRNMLINGDFRIWQRGVVGVDAVRPKYCADRFLFGCAGSAFAPYSIIGEPGMPMRTGMRIGQTAGNAGVAAIQRVESTNCMFVSGDKLTFSLYIKGDVARTIQYSIKAANSVDDFSSTTLVKTGNFIISAGAWQRFETTFDASPACLNGVEVRVDLDSANAIALGVFSTTGWQLERGSVATPFETRPHGLELSLCQRYFRISKSGDAHSYMGVMAVLETANGLRQSFDYSGMYRVPTVTVNGNFQGESLGGALTFVGSGLRGSKFIRLDWVASAPSTPGMCTHIRDAGGNNAQINYDSEL